MMIVVSISWYDGEFHHEFYGPFTVRADGSHLAEVEEFMKRWMRENDGRHSTMVLHLVHPHKAVGR
ncbi:hypothetical protein [Streptosporangium sp. NPDC051022]|uniref:hypothetical protein n=1 Tax=Streptosporangium sp. NPDC051022 TaxID=3155752 RepID=UPI003444CE3A